MAEGHSPSERKRSKSMQNSHLLLALMVLVAPLLASAQKKPTLTSLSPMPSSMPVYKNPFRLVHNLDPVFGYPGAACPKGSKPYAGPEAKDAKGSGVVYCTFVRKYLPIARKDADGKCPNGAKMIDDGDPEIIWCDREGLKFAGPNAPPPAMPMMPPMPPAPPVKK